MSRNSWTEFRKYFKEFVDTTLPPELDTCALFVEYVIDCEEVAESLRRQEEKEVAE